MLKKFDLPPIWALGLAVLSYLLARFVPVYSIAHWFPGVAGWLVPLVIFDAGILLVFWSAFWFRRKATSIHPYSTPTSLIVEGPFRFSRNPIYSGMAVALTGLALWFGALSAFAGPVLFVWVIGKRFIEREEAALREQFGEEAVRYLKATRRW